MERVMVVELVNKCTRIIMKTTTNPLYRLLRIILFGIRSWLFDSFYDTTNEEELSEALEEYKKMIEEQGIEYLPDSFDCDDFAMSFKSFFSLKYRKNSIGLALGVIKKDGRVLGGHAWNITILDDGTIVYIEPQIFEYFDPPISPDNFEYELIAVIW